MLTYPKTAEEAKKYRYGQWAGSPEGHNYDDTLCAYEVRGSGRAIMFYQCCRRNGHGPGKLYCKHHAKKVEGE